MPLQVVCPTCNAKLRAPDTAAGKKTKCPKCQAVISVPADAPQAPAASPGSAKKAENWHMQTTDGSQFGPVPRTELDAWFKEGRISADCQLLKEGADQWQWASEIYPSLEQPEPTVAPSKQAAGFDFLGPAVPTNSDPLSLGNAALGTPLPSTALSNYQAPSQASAPSFGGASLGGTPIPSYGGGYGAPANPYSSPSVASYSNYGKQARAGLHPMVVIASIIEFLQGGLYLLGSLGFGVFMIILLVGGAAIATNAPSNNNPDNEAAMAAIAAMSGMGALCLLPFALLFLALSILMIYTGVGLLKKRFWAKIVAIVMSILHLLPQLLMLFLSIISLDPCNLITSLVGIALNATVLVAMLIPDGTSDFT
ncbi:MAG: GYF domain-containing protein [Pirellulaceae bacterium]